MIDPDENRDETRRRFVDLALCECCHQELPEQSGRGARIKFCPDGVGRYEPGFHCRELGPALNLVRRAIGTEAIPGAEVERLGLHVQAVLDVLGDTGPIAVLTNTLTTVHGHLGDTVEAAIARAERAEEDARTAEGQAAADQRLRGIAEQQATTALQEKATAERLAQRAVADRDTALTAQRRAEQDLAAAVEGRRLEHERAERAERAAADVRQRVTEVERDNTELVTQLATVRTELAQANQRAIEERQRADTAVADATRIREETATTIELVRAETAQQIAAAHAETTAAVARQGVVHAERIRELERDHAAELGDRDRQVVAAQTARTDLIRRTRTTLQRLLASSTPEQPGEAHPDPEAAAAQAADRARQLREGVDELLHELDTDPAE